MIARLSDLCAAPACALAGKPTSMHPVLSRKGRQALEITGEGVSRPSRTVDPRIYAQCRMPLPKSSRPVLTRLAAARHRNRPTSPRPRSAPVQPVSPSEAEEAVIRAQCSNFLAAGPVSVWFRAARRHHSDPRLFDRTPSLVRSRPRAASNSHGSIREHRRTRGPGMVAGCSSLGRLRSL